MPSAPNAMRTMPLVDTLTAPFWRAAAAGRLVLPRCPETGELCWPPRRHPPADETHGLQWVETPGIGTVYTFSVVYRSSHAWPPVPYVLAVVRLDEGVHLTTNIVNVDPGKIRIGMPVKVTFEQLGEDLRLPVFCPVEA